MPRESAHRRQQHRRRNPPFGDVSSSTLFYPPPAFTNPTPPFQFANMRTTQTNSCNATITPEALAGFASHPAEAPQATQESWAVQPYLSTNSLPQPQFELPAPLLSSGVNFSSHQFPSDGFAPTISTPYPMTPQDILQPSPNLNTMSVATTPSSRSTKVSKSSEKKRSSNIAADQRYESQIACPFYRLDRYKYICCREFGFKDCKALKMHLFRTHMCPQFYCKHCGSDDSTQYQVPCWDCSSPGYEFISTEQRTAIEGLKPKRGSWSIEQWYREIWNILFQGRPVPASIRTENVRIEAISVVRDSMNLVGREVIRRVTGSTGTSSATGAYALFWRVLDTLVSELSRQGAGMESVPSEPHAPVDYWAGGDVSSFAGFDPNWDEMQCQGESSTSEEYPSLPQ